MDFNHLFRGIPDGTGLQEDPGHLSTLYKEVEQTCFSRNDPHRIMPARLWFPLGNYLDSLEDQSLSSRWNTALRLFEAYRFCEASLASVQLISDKRYQEIQRIFAEMPPHLQTLLFGVELEQPLNQDQLRHLFRRAFRISWFFANNDESVMAHFDIEEEEFERITHSNAPELLKLAGQQLNLFDEARATSRQVQQIFRTCRSNEDRIELMTRVQSILEMRRSSLTAFFKAIESEAEK